MLCTCSHHQSDHRESGCLKCGCTKFQVYQINKIDSLVAQLPYAMEAHCLNVTIQHLKFKRSKLSDAEKAMYGIVIKGLEEDRNNYIKKYADSST